LKDENMQKKPASTQPDSDEVSNPARENEMIQFSQTVSFSSVRPFPIIGIGTSAGGLEALEAFLKNVAPGSGMAFAIVQHLDPTHKGILTELLQRATPMQVVQVTDRLTVEPNTVYVIPPNKDMSILHGVLHLLDPVTPRGLRLPIDFFFRALADDQQEHSVGVILSGMGSDGTLGLRAIKEKGGMVFVQTPASAKFDGMPRSAIDAGLADVVAAVEELPARISAYLKRTPLIPHPDLILESKNQSAIEKIFILLRAQTGQDFSLYKKSTIYRRIERRMGIHQIDRIVNYIRFLQENPQEIELLFKELLIGVTSFFRDPAAWEQLKSEIIPMLMTSHPQDKVLRAWTPGCSTGEEAYSLAMTFKEALEQVQPDGHFSLQIFATDLDRDAIDQARAGFYPLNISADVSPEHIRRFFVSEEHGYRIKKEIREMVIFAPQNLVMDPPFTRLDLLICRNLLIYLTPELQKKLMPLFHYSLNPGGILFLGSAETIGSFSDLFIPLPGGGKQRLYRRIDSGLPNEPVNFPASFYPPLPSKPDPGEPLIKSQTPTPNLQVLVEQLLLQQFAPPAVLTNNQGDILYISGHTGKYLELAAGKVNWNLFAMAREGLRYELNNAFHKALHEKTTVTLKNIVVGTNGGSQTIDVVLRLLTEPETLRDMMLVAFSDVPAPPSRKAHSTAASSSRLIQLEQELQHSQEELQITREEMQTSQEELKSTNEELQSTNEELQSTNEELTTSKEEMQSLNEEMQTVNHELQARVDELSRANNDLKNLLNSTDIATLFLDEQLRVRRFTHPISKIIKLIPGDVGRPVTDIVSDLLYPALSEDVDEVLRSLVSQEKPITTRDGRWFMVRIMPYRTLDNRIDGVVITFMDISVAKKLETILRESERDLKALLNHTPNAFAQFESVFDEQGQLITGRFNFVNNAYERMTGVKNAQLQGKTIHEVWPAVIGATGGRPPDLWIQVLGQVAISGVDNTFELEHVPTAKRYRCRAYRPGESRERFCVIFEEIGL
jgi:two-component system CheB/CheR fusion protein